MKRIVAVTMAVVLASLLCQLAFSAEEDAGRRPRGRPETSRSGAVSEEMRKLREESQKIMDRLQEINQNEKLRAVSREAGQEEAVQKARERVLKAEEALQKAQDNAMRALDSAIMNRAKRKGDRQLIKLVWERRELTEKLRKLREQYPRPTRGRPSTGGGGIRSPRGGTREGRPRQAEES